jgi:Mycothiol maleylpyruvate isomerase N-terminal domain.
MDSLRYPIGSFEAITDPTQEQRSSCIERIPELAVLLKELLAELLPEQLNTPYRPEGWTIRQIVHHMADNDMNAYIRLRRALTEAEPVASSYREDLWAELGDYEREPIEVSLDLMESLHCRLYGLLQHLEEQQYKRKFSTQALGLITVDVAIQRFVWHNHHHTEQIRMFLQRKGWI